MSSNIKVIFSLVLYNHRLSDLRQLLVSISAHATDFTGDSILLYKDNSGCDNHGFIIEREIKTFLSFCNPSLRVLRLGSTANVGYGSGHNLLYHYACSVIGPFSYQDLFVVVNPDISFNSTTIGRVNRFMQDNRRVVCVAPLVLSVDNCIQYSAKRNPTLSSLFWGRLSTIPFIGCIGSAYLFRHQNRFRDYYRDVFCVQYISGCFMVVRASVYGLSGGFDERFFLHLEDADFSRTLSAFGMVCHFPGAVVFHSWARGSHRSIRQSLWTVRSALIYFRKWGYELC